MSTIFSVKFVPEYSWRRGPETLGLCSARIATPAIDFNPFRRSGVGFVLAPGYIVHTSESKFPRLVPGRKWSLFRVYLISRFSNYVLPT